MRLGSLRPAIERIGKMRMSSVRHRIAHLLAAMQASFPRTSRHYAELSEHGADANRRARGESATARTAGSSLIRRAAPTVILAVACATLSVVAWFLVSGWENA